AATSLPPCWFHTPKVRVKAQVAPEWTPSKLKSAGPPTTAVLPSPEIATELPRLIRETEASLTPSRGPCWFQVPLARAKTHAAPAAPLSSEPAVMIVLPSPETARAPP